MTDLCVRRCVELCVSVERPIVASYVSSTLLRACSLPVAAQAQNPGASPIFRTTSSSTEDGSAVVTERITLVFVGEWHGIHRTIPIEYPGPNGTNYELFLKVTSVTDGSGGKLKYDSSTSNGVARSEDLYSRRGRCDAHGRDYLPGAQRHALFRRITTSFTGTLRATIGRCRSITRRRRCDSRTAAAGSLRAQAFTGVYGSTQRDASAKVDGRRGAVRDQQSPAHARRLDHRCLYSEGHSQGTERADEVFLVSRRQPDGVSAAGHFAGMFALWWYKGRDPDPGMSVAPMYEPPAGISPAEAGTLLDDTIHPRDITSTIVDLAVRGYIKIEETAEKILVFTHKDYVFHLLKPREQWGADLAPHERVMLENIFAGGRRDAALQPEEPLLYGGSGDSPGHYVGAEEEGNLSARSGVGQWIQRGSGGRDSRAVRAFCSSWDGRTFSIPRRC